MRGEVAVCPAGWASGPAGLFRPIHLASGPQPPQQFALQMIIE